MAWARNGRTTGRLSLRAHAVAEITRAVQAEHLSSACQCAVNRGRATGIAQRIALAWQLSRMPQLLRTRRACHTRSFSNLPVRRMAAQPDVKPGWGPACCPASPSRSAGQPASEGQVGHPAPSRCCQWPLAAPGRREPRLAAEAAWGTFKFKLGAPSPGPARGAAAAGPGASELSS